MISDLDRSVGFRYFLSVANERTCFANFKLLQNDPDTGRIFPQPPLISFKRDKNIGTF